MTTPVRRYTPARQAGAANLETLVAGGAIGVRQIATRVPTAAEIDAMCVINTTKLRRLANSKVKGDVLSGYANALELHRRAAEINTLLRVSHFVSQLAHECAHFTRMVESFAYKPERAFAVFPKYFASAADAEKVLAKDTTGEAFAEVVYGGRMGNTKPGDGYRYRGRGFIQLTGRAQYKAMSDLLVNQSVDLVADPDRAAEPDIAARIAVAYWKKTGLNAHADRDDVTAVTKAINGGTKGLAERRQLLTTAKAAFYPKP